MKKAISLTLAFMMIFALAAGCGDGGSGGSGDGAVLKFDFEADEGLTITGGSLGDDSERGKVLTLNGGSKGSSSASIDTDVLSKTDWSDGMTIAFWVKAANSDPGISPLYSFNIADHGAEGYIATTDSLELGINTDGNSGEAEYPRVWADPADQSPEAKPVLTAGKWQHVAVTLSSTGMTIYLDGQKYSEPALGPSSANFKLFIDQIQYCYGLQLGNWNCMWWDDIGSFAGSFDQVRVYNKTLSADEVGKLMSTGAIK